MKKVETKESYKQYLSFYELRLQPSKEYLYSEPYQMPIQFVSWTEYWTMAPSGHTVL